MSRISDLAGFSTALSTTNDLSVGIITATTFSGDGSGLTGVASTDNIQTATDAKFLANVNITGVTTATGGVNVGTAATIYANGNIAAAGIVTANGGFVGGLTGNVTGNVTGNADTATTATTATNAQGLTGTPNITVGSVAASSGTVSGNLSIGGTLTYQDVEHVDSVGIITAQQGIQVLANGANITGIVTVGVTTFKSGEIEVVGVVTATTVKAGSAISITDGAVSATRFHGDGSNLTGISVGGVGTESITATDRTIATLNLSKDAHKVNVSGVATIDCQGGTEYETHILTIVNTGIATVGFSTYFLFPSGSEPSIPTASGTISQLSFTVHRVGAAGTQVLTTAALNFS